MTKGLDTILTLWQLTEPENLFETPIARLWRVKRSDGTSAVLKLYKQADRGNEAAGADFLHTRANAGAVEIFTTNGAAVLMQYLDGPSLGDIARSGDLKVADQLLITAARNLHRTQMSSKSNLQPLDRVFSSLFQLKIAHNCRPDLRQLILRATDIAQGLLASQSAPSVPLHGDLHYDNIILTTAGTRVFDAKGYIGDPAFELANALRHPKGLTALVRDPDRIKRTIPTYAKAMNVPPQRLAYWAAAKCALSIAWRSNGLLSQDDESDLLGLLLDQATQ